jgi:muramidase (phage lysozyme)
LLDTLAGGESKDYTTIVGGQTFSDFSKHPNVRVRQKDGSISTAAGRYQFTNSTWKDTIAKYNTNNPSDPITDFSPASQDKAALFLANQDYKRRSGRDLQADLNSGMPMGQNLKDGLGGHGRDTTWQSLQNPSAGSLDAAFTSNLSRNLSYGTTGNKIPDVGSGIVGTSLPGASLRGSRLSVVDNAAKNGIQNTDPRLKAILDEASKGLPDGYRAELYSGFRPGDTRNHGKGMADDIRIIDKDGKTLPNYQSPETFRTYEKFAQSARKAQMSLYPDLKDSFRWGGYLTGGAKDPFKGYGASDQMHFDLDGKHGMGAGSWENGLNNKFKGIFDTASNPSMGLGDISSYGPSSAVSALSTKVKLQSIANNPLFTPSSTPSAFSTAVGPSQDELNQTGIALGKGIVQAQQNTPNIPTFDPTSINSSVTNAVDSAPAGTPAAKTAPKGDTAPTNGPNIDSIPHTDELSMMMANSQMMA